MEKRKTESVQRLGVRVCERKRKTETKCVRERERQRRRGRKYQERIGIIYTENLTEINQIKKKRSSAKLERECFLLPLANRTKCKMCGCVMFVWCELCVCVCACVCERERGVAVLFPLPLFSWVRGHPQYM